MLGVHGRPERVFLARHALAGWALVWVRVCASVYGTSLRQSALSTTPTHPYHTQSDVVKIDLTEDPPSVVLRVTGVGNKAHGLVEWLEPCTQQPVRLWILAGGVRQTSQHQLPGPV